MTNNSGEDECLRKSVVDSIVLAIEKLSGSDADHAATINIAFNLLDVLKSVNNRFDLTVVEAAKRRDILSPVLAALRDRPDLAPLDLFACLFAYCSVINALQPLVVKFVQVWNKDDYLREALARSAAGSPRTTEKLGFYSVISYLENFHTLDHKSLSYLNLQLERVLVDHWLPLWASYLKVGTTTSLQEWIVQERFLLRIHDESVQDFIIALKCQDVDQWHHLAALNMSSWNYFIYMTSNRFLRFSDSQINQPSFKEFALGFLTKCVGNDSFTLLHSDPKFKFQVLMEVLDHSEMNFFQEPHLMNLLKIALSQFYVIVRDNSTDDITNLHLQLGELGTTQSLPALINMLLFVVARFLINVGNVTEAGVNQQNDPNWFKRYDKHVIPSSFHRLLPQLPPISKSLFAFDYASTYLPSNIITNYSQIITNLLDSLILLLSINRSLLVFYHESQLGSLHFMDYGSNNVENCNENEAFQGIENDTSLQFMELYYIPLVTALLLSDQLLESPADSPKLVSPKLPHINGRLLFIHVLKCLEQLIDNHGSSALYHLIKFLSMVSIEDLSIQKKSILLLNHLFFHGDSDHILQLCLQNELTTQALNDYISLWNDGSKTYGLFFTQVFKRKQPEVSVVSKTYGDLLRLIPEYKPPTYSAASSSTAVTLSIPMHSSPPDTLMVDTTPLQTPTLNKPKFNTNATSFIPQNMNMATPSRHSPSNSVALPPQPPSTLYASFPSPMLFGSGNSAMTQLPTPIAETYASSTSFYMPQQTIVRPTPTRHSSYPSMPTSNSTGSSTASNATGTPQHQRTWQPPTGTPTGPSSYGQQQQQSPSFMTSTGAGKLVNSGKNYILGGHNRAVNNSRSQSIHVDEFEKMQI
ncbi:AaceriAFR467Wp [[Ashbya] aceris (nom. inval.)]|nr:AaceriAFR467Wp [[Ashbya] aceris (nom. inval.)]